MPYMTILTKYEIDEAKEKTRNHPTSCALNNCDYCKMRKLLQKREEADDGRLLDRVDLCAIDREIQRALRDTFPRTMINRTNYRYNNEIVHHPEEYIGQATTYENDLRQDDLYRGGEADEDIENPEDEENKAGSQKKEENKDQQEASAQQKNKSDAAGTA